MTLVDPAPPPITTQVLDVEVTVGSAPAPWSAPLSGEGGCADERAVLLPDGPARLYVADGDRLVLDSPPGERAAYDYLVYSSGRRFLQVQRGVLGLHAATVLSPEGVCLAIVGTSGAGKSTTMVELLRAGWLLCCDDTPDVVVDAGIPHVVPHPRPVHLDAAALAVLGAPADAGLVLARSGKRAVSIEQDLAVRRLDAVVLLDAQDGLVGVQQEVLEPAAALKALAARSSIGGLLLLPAFRESYLRWLAAIASRTRIASVRRPAGVDSRAEVVAAVLAAVGAGPKP